MQPIHLLTAGPLPRLHPMLPHTRSNRRGIALLAAILLVLCQAAFVAQAYAQVGAAADAVALPCHHASDDADPAPSHEGVRPGCEAPAMTAEPVNVPLTALAALPSITLTASPPHVDGRFPGLQAYEPDCRPPPLTVLHCRFLN